MKNIKVCLIMRNSAGELLLQKRDEEPECGKWVLFGGSVESNENEETALRREIFEELGFEIGLFHFLTRYKDNNTEQVIFVLDEPVEPAQLQLHEGLDMKFFSKDDIEKLNIGFNFKEILLDYLNDKNR